MGLTMLGDNKSSMAYDDVKAVEAESLNKKTIREQCTYHQVNLANPLTFT